MRLGLFSPGSPSRPDPFAQGLAWLTAHGFTVVRTEGDPVGSGLHAGPPQERAAALHRLASDPEVEAVLCVRGGSGTPAILPHLDFDLLRRHPKTIIGMSDVTALHLAGLASGGPPGISAPMVVQLSAELPGYSAESWLRAVRGPFPAGEVPLPPGAALEAVVGAGAPDEAEGFLVPCNLSLLAALVGTRFLPSLDGGILVLEEIQETPQSLDRMVTQLSLSGALRGIRGLILGQFTECCPHGEGVREEDGRDLVLAWARALRVPALAGFPYGHEPICCALPVGARARVTIHPPALQLLEAAGTSSGRA
jgi:muramoyltetrapeptide carboxypeptidase